MKPNELIGSEMGSHYKSIQPDIQQIQFDKSLELIVSTRLWIWKES